MIGVILFMWGVAIALLASWTFQYFLFNKKDDDEKND